MPCPVPRRTRTGARVGCFPACTAFPVSQAGRRPCLHFRDLLRLHSRYGLIARSPKATFVTRLQPGQLPNRAARQLPAQPTTRWVVPSSTGKPRRLGALGNPGWSDVWITMDGLAATRATLLRQSACAAEGPRGSSEDRRRERCPSQVILWLL